jgi:hypothetical protein
MPSNVNNWRLARIYFHFTVPGRASDPWAPLLFNDIATVDRMCVNEFPPEHCLGDWETPCEAQQNTGDCVNGSFAVIRSRASFSTPSPSAAGTLVAAHSAWQHH